MFCLRNIHIFFHIYRKEDKEFADQGIQDLPATDKYSDTSNINN